MKVKGLALACVASIVLFSSCMEKNLYDPEKAAQYQKLLKEYEYAANFTKKYGAIPADYSWDTSSPRHWAATTRAGEGDFTTSDYEDVQPQILEWMNNSLVEGKNNKALGRQFVMAVPNNEFTIMPIYQGKAKTQGYDFCVVVNDTPIKMWSKSEGMQACDATYVRSTTSDEWVLESVSEWYDVASKDPLNGMDNNTIQATTYYNAQGKSVSAETSAVKKVVVNHKVRAQKYTFDLRQYAGQMMYLYLEITTNNNSTSAKKGTKQSSLNGMMVALDGCPQPEGLEEGTQTLIVGCEAASNNSDWDMNEVVFLIYGKPYPPEVIEIKNNQIDLVTSKRYMFEDLGSIGDFDFNDVVVDMMDIHTIQLEYTNGVKTKEEEVAHRQEAVVRNLGGTIPFELMIGDTKIYSGGSPATFCTTPNKQITLPSENIWIPEENNVSLRVYGEDGEPVYVTFPEKGSQAPMGIATDVDAPWMPERESITLEWFNSLKK